MSLLTNESILEFLQERAFHKNRSAFESLKIKKHNGFNDYFIDDELVLRIFTEQGHSNGLDFSPYASKTEEQTT